MAKSTNLTPSQAKVKRPRPIRYEGEEKNCEAYIARDIITLYVTCGLGYSPIRHILGLDTDKLIEDVVRQHMLGRHNADGTIGELKCPPKKSLDSTAITIINEMTNQRYNTYSDPYIVDMINNKTWSDDPVYTKPLKCSCGAELQPEWRICPYCGDTRSLAK